MLETTVQNFYAGFGLWHGSIDQGSCHSSTRAKQFGVARGMFWMFFLGEFFFMGVLKIETSKSTRSSNLVDQHFLRFFQLRTWDCPDQDMSQFMEKIRERWRRRNRRWQALAWCCGWKKVARNKRNKRCCCCFARFLQPQMALSIEKNMEKWSSNGRNHRFFVWYIPY